MMNKKALELKLGLYAIIAFGVVIMAAGIWINDWNAKYNSGLDYDLGELNRMNDVSSSAGTSQNKLSPENADPGTDFETTTYRGAFSIINSIFTPYRAVFGDNGMIDSITERFGVPDYVRQMIVTFIVLAIVFAIISIIFRIPGGTT